MMKNEKPLKEKLHLLDIEDTMYILFIVSSLLNISTNEEVRKMYVGGSNPNEKIRDKYLVSSYLVLIVFIAFTVRNYNNLTKLPKDSKQYNLAQIRLIGTILLVVGQCIAIYYLYNTDSYSGSPI